MDIGLRALLSGFDEAKKQFAELNKEIDKTTASTEKLNPTSKQATTELGGLADAAKEGKSVFEGLSTTTIAVAGVLGAGLAYAASAATGKLIEAFNTVRTLGDDLNDMSQRLGISVESLSTYKLAAETSGMSINSFGSALKIFSRNIIEATKEQGASADAFERLGLSIREPNGALKDTDTLIREVADKFSMMEDGAGKTALAMQIFGRAGSDMIPLLNSGAAGLDRLAAEAKKAGIVMSTETARAADELNDNMAVLNAVAQGFWISFASPVVEALAKVTTAMRDARRAGDSLFGSLFEGMKKAAQMAFGVGDEKQELGGVISSLQNLYAQRAKAQQILDAGATGTARKIALGQIERLDPEIRKFEERRDVLAAVQPGQFEGPAKVAAPEKGPKPEKGGRTDTQREKTPEQVFAQEERYFRNIMVLGQKTEEDLIEFYDKWAERAGNNANFRVEIEAKAFKLREQLEAKRSKEIQSALDAEAKASLSRLKHQETVETEANKRGVEAAVQAAKQKLHAKEKQILGETRLTEQQKLERLEALRDEMRAEEYLADVSKEWRTRMARLDNQIAEQKIKVANETAVQIEQIFGRSANTTVDLFKGLHKGLTGVFEDILHGNLSLTNSISKLWSSLVDSMITTLAQIASKAVLEPIFEEFKGVLDPVFKDVGSMLKGAFSSAWQWIKSLFSDSDLFSGISTGITGVFEGLFGSSGGSSGGSVLGSVGSIINSFFGGGAAEAGGGGWLSGLGFGSFAGPAAIAGAVLNTDSIMETAGNLFDAVFDFFPTGTDMVVSKPTAFVAGDAGPERVTVSPLSGAARHGMGGGGGRSVVFQGINIIDEYTMRKFKRQLGV